MKKLKLIFGLLMVAAFVATTVLSTTGSENQAINKGDQSARQVPTNG